MRRDWNRVGLLLHTIEKLAGHPNLKELRDDALADLKDLAEQPSESVQPTTELEVESGSEPEAELKVSRRSL